MSASELPRSGYFLRHWRGEFSLNRSYWVHMLIPTLILPDVGLMLTSVFAGQSARYVSTVLLIGLGLAVIFWVWALWGAWQSSVHYVERGGSVWYALLIRFLMFLCIVYIFSCVSPSSGHLQSYWKIALGNQPSGPFTVTVTADGRAIHVSGGMNDGVTAAIERQLKTEPEVRTIMFDSGGGWVREGQLSAALIRRYKLDTYVEGDCNSACTIAFLAGEDRALAPSGRLGFHRFRSMGEARSNGSDDMAAMLAYRDAGVTQVFVNQVLKTSADQIWFPEAQELLDAHVITRLSSGGELALASTRFKTRDDLEKELLHDRLFVIVSKRFPDQFSSLLDEVWLVSRQHVSDARFVDAARANLQPLYQEQLRGAPDNVFDDIGRLQLEEAQFLQAGNVRACAHFLDHRASTGANPGWPANLADQERNITYQVLATGTTQIPPPPSKQAMQAVFSKVRERMLPEQSSLLDGDAEHQDVAPHLRCSAVISYLQVINSLESQDRALLLRLMYTPPSPE